MTDVTTFSLKWNFYLNKSESKIKKIEFLYNVLALRLMFVYFLVWPVIPQSRMRWHLNICFNGSCVAKARKRTKKKKNSNKNNNHKHIDSNLMGCCATGIRYFTWNTYFYRFILGTLENPPQIFRIINLVFTFRKITLTSFLFLLYIFSSRILIFHRQFISIDNFMVNLF